eukprot:6475587-Amphidinium_carterae.3
MDLAKPKKSHHRQSFTGPPASIPSKKRRFRCLHKVATLMLSRVSPLGRGAGQATPKNHSSS